MTKHTGAQSTPADPGEPRCWNSGPGSLVWSLSQRFWLMSDYFPTTNYGNNAERDEEHNSAAALQNFLIPQVELQRERQPSSPTSLSERDNCWRFCREDKLFFFLFSSTTSNTGQNHELIQSFSEENKKKGARLPAWLPSFIFSGDFMTGGRQNCTARFLWRTQSKWCHYSTGVTLCNQENFIT